MAWAGNGVGDADGIFFQRYGHDGVVPQAGTPPANVTEKIANVTVVGVQQNPTAAMSPAGAFVIAWEGPDGTGNGTGIFLHCFDNTGTAVGAADIAVNTTVLDEQTKPSVAMAADGSFVVAWQAVNYPGDASGAAIVARRFTSACTTAAAGAEFLVNTTKTLSQADPSVAVEPDGDFVIAWTSNQEGGTDGPGIYFKTYKADGSAVLGETHANATTAGTQQAPAVGVDKNGNLVLVWESPDASGVGIFARRFDAAGSPLAAEFQVNTTTASDQKAPAIAVDVAGRFALTWQGTNAGDGTLDIYTRQYDAAGTALSAETVANTAASSAQQKPAIAADADGDYVLAWESDQTPANGIDVYARRFAGPENVDLMLTQTDSLDPVGSAGAYNYVFTVKNNHAVSTLTGLPAIDTSIGAADGIKITDVLSGPTYVTTTSTSWTCTGTTTLVCSFTDILAPQATTTLTLNMQAPAAAPNADVEVSSAGTASGNQYDPSPPNNAANNSDTEKTAVCATPSAGAVQFSAATFSDGEGAGTSAVVTVTRTGGTCGSVTVNVNAAAGATNGASSADYTFASPYTVTFLDGDPADKTVPITILQDALDEQNETITLTLANPDRATLGVQNTTATFTITDDDPTPTVSLSRSDAPASTDIPEASGTATLTATLSAVSGQQVTVPVNYSGTANTADYTRAAGSGGGSGSSITIPAGSSSGSIVITATQDNIDEPNETITAAIGTGTSAPTNATKAGSDVTLTIADDDATPTVKFRTLSSTVNETTGTPTVNLIVDLSGPSSQNVSVNFSTSGNAAPSGTNADYTFDTDSGTTGSQGSPLTIAAGSTSGTIVVSIPPDALDEDAELTANPLPDENAVFTIGNVVNANADATPANLVYTLGIHDNDVTPTLTLGVAGAPIAENGGVATVTATLNAASGLDVTIPIVYSGTARHDGTCGPTQATPTDASCAATGTNLSNGGTSTSIKIPAGSTTGTITVTGTPDTLDEPNTEAVLVDIAPGVVNANESGTAQVSIAITDDAADTPPTVTLSQDTSSVAETGGVGTVTATLGAVSGQNVTVTLAFSGTASHGAGCGGTVANPADYTCSAATIVIPEGSLSGSMTISATSDAAYEPTESIIVDMTCAAPVTCNEATPQQVTFSLLDDDQVPQVSFVPDTAGGSISTSAADESGDLGTPGQKLVTVQLSRVSGDDVILPYTVGMGTADAADYTLASSPLVIPAGAISGTITVNINNDPNDEYDQTVIINLGTPVNATLVAPGSHTFTIIDNDGPPSVNFAAGQSVPEPNAGGTTVTVSASSTVTSEKDITIPYTVGGTATNPADHDAVNGTLTILARSSSGSVTFNALSDTLDENDETVTFTMGTPITNATAGSTTTHTVTITDDPADTPPAVTLSLAGSPMAEAAGSSTVTATLAAVSGRTVTVNLAYSGTAVSADYMASATSITILAGSLTGTATLTAKQDSLDEANETIIVDMSCGTTCTEATLQQVTATITDDDPAPTVNFTDAAQTVTEGTGTGTTAVTVTVSLSAVSGQIVSVPFTLGGTASANDSTAASGTISIPAGATTADYSFTVTRDGDFEPDETVIFTMGTPGNATKGATSVDTVTITNDDAKPDSGGGSFDLMSLLLLIPAFARRRRRLQA